MASTNGSSPPGKAVGDISDSFASLSGRQAQPLSDRFRELKLRLVAGHEDAVVASWKRLLAALRRENELIARAGPAIIPEVRFSHLHADLRALKPEIHKRGVALIRGVIPEDEARAYKFEIEEYVRQNPHTRGFPPSAPQVLELYWSPTQLRARCHPALLQTQTALMTALWRTSDPRAPVSLRTPLCYADRLRIRTPGDAAFALGPHQDGGSVERWEEQGYGRGGVYEAVFSGRWDADADADEEHAPGGYDPFDAAGRVHAVTDLYGGLGACSMFRMFQGWLAMSRAAPGEGTLLVNPLVRESAVYALLRPFFRARKGLPEVGGDKDRFLEEGNWEFTAGEKMDSELHGAMPGCAQEFPEGLHPHLELERTMVHVPEVRPGDYVVWHCDTIHAVDKKHGGTSDSSVLYIPVCPTTKASAEYVARQRAAFLQGTPGPDFPGGEGESRHIGRATEDYVKKYCDPVGVQAMGLGKLATVEGDTEGGKAAVQQANEVLGF
ncbi:uncharacterized protein THITE_2052208 [Thermothielavioides terrestris NRRL 8126]|uniref:DUF1479-domain-containing protein n=1 Tax=Thermothielavioides terrestris (strain ATCC 38088 / NRRL 8126) TaxID=578455 RepID=G2R8F5_THETT|nr:uncharacterized protein THITE_2052208 [Thermothielavioides terrestris NRRL 8126]AEO68213.1 hypothetical protein THITE_2052208 [Thermothielavioides terrestris NRRL 8126]